MLKQINEQSRFAAIKNKLKQHERKILITATVVSTGAAIVMRTGIAQHNEFLRQHDLYEQFYDITNSIEA